MQPTFIIEIQNDDIGKQVENILKSDIYLYFNIDETGRLIKTENIYKTDNRNYLICNKKISKQLKLDKSTI